MIRNYDEDNEISEIVKSLPSLPNYQGYRYDQDLGFYKSLDLNNKLTSIKLGSNEAIIGLRQPIPKMAQHHLLLVEKEKGNWRIKKVLEISEK